MNLWTLKGQGQISTSVYPRTWPQGQVVDEGQHSYQSMRPDELCTHSETIRIALQSFCKELQPSKNVCGLIRLEMTWTMVTDPISPGRSPLVWDMIIITFWDDQWQDYHQNKIVVESRFSPEIVLGKNYRSKLIGVRVTKFSGKMLNYSKLWYWELRCNPMLFTRVILKKKNRVSVHSPPSPTLSCKCEDSCRT